MAPLYLQFRQPRFLDTENDDDGEAIEMDRLRKLYFNRIAKECPYGRQRSDRSVCSSTEDFND